MVDCRKSSLHKAKVERSTTHKCVEIFGNSYISVTEISSQGFNSNDNFKYHDKKRQKLNYAIGQSLILTL